MQAPFYRFPRIISSTVLFALLLVGLYAISLYNYLLFHTLAELFSITIAGSIFLIAWNSRERLDNGYFLFLGMVYLSVGFLDLLHTLAYKGMGVFPGRDANLPTQLWIATRYLESIALLVAPVFLSRRGRVLPGLAVYCLALALMLSIFWWGFFPDCYLEGVGLTTFKILSEYLICLILVGAGLFLYKKRAFFEARVFHFLLWAIFFTILSELSFTFYVSVYGLSNLTGHFFKLASFYLVYRALVITGFIRPQELLFQDLVRSRKALQRSEALLKTTSRMAMAGGWEMDVQTGEITWTEGTYQIYEMPVDQRPSMEKAIECFHQEDRPKLLRAFEDAKERGLPYDLELQFITTKGKDLWTRSICQPVVENGKVVKLEGAFQDTTERKQIQEILEKSERRYRQLFEAMISSFALHEIILDQNGEACDYRFLEVNPSFERLTDIKARDLLGRTVMEVFPDTEAHWIDTYGQVALNGQSVRFENYAQAMDKHFEVLAYSPMPGQFATIVQDITERKRAEKELQGSKEQYRELAENLNDVIYTIDLDGTITYVSPPIRSILDYTPAELIGSNFAHLIHPDDQPAIRQAFEGVLQGHLTPREYRVKTKSGDYRWVRTSSRPSFEGGRPSGLQGVLTDITERKLAEQALLEDEKLRAALETVGMVHHELNQPLQIIMGMSELVLGQPDPADNAKKNLEQIVAAAKRLSNIINKLDKITGYKTKSYAGQSSILDLDESTKSDD